MAILEMKNISKSFFGIPANEHVSLSVEKGEIHALLGENGAGKTTLMNILFGIYSADEGEVLWKGEKISFRSPREAIAEGIGMVHQHFSLIKKMTVLDNIILGLKEESGFLDRNKSKKKIDDLAKKYGLEVKADAKINQLSVGEQQRVEILKVLYREVDLLILDEPTGVLTPTETKHFFTVLKRLRQEGYAIIIITHRMSEIMEISDKVTILRDGCNVKSLITKETTPSELSRYMIGRELCDSFDVKPVKASEEALVLSGVTLQKKNKKPVLDHIDLTVHKGEIVGIAGVDGNGQKELAEVIAGIQKHTQGQMEFLGKNIEKDSVKSRFIQGISYISDDRHSDGLIMDMNIMDNLILRNYYKPPCSKGLFLNRKHISEITRQAIDKLKIKTAGLEIPVKVLSGGNQQKVILAREIVDEAKVVIANQPTRGLDIGATEFIRQMLMKQRNDNKSVLLISADLEEIMALSDRIAVMFSGKIVGILNRDEANIETIGLLMGGITNSEVTA